MRGDNYIICHAEFYKAFLRFGLETILKAKLLKNMVILNDISPKANVPEFSVSELSSAIKRSLEQGFSHVRVRAECGRVTIAKSGHIYLDLKDKDAIISGIIWAGVARALQTKPEEGLEVIATGKITTFPGQSKYQIIIERLEPAGMGAILLQLEERRKRLAAEGLFDASKKRAIPYLPKTIGVITSPTGAVIRDILHRLSDRFPVHVMVWPVLVQGDKAAAQIAHAIEGFNNIDDNGEISRPDTLIVARGGGSIEDLWAFNEEIVVRAAANSKIPLISAVGHETDTTLIDYASDLRAPTPTGAAEMAVPVRNELIARLNTIAARKTSAIIRFFENSALHFRAVSNIFPKPETLFANLRQRLDIQEMKLVPALKSLIFRASSNFDKAKTGFSPHLLNSNLRAKKERLNNLHNRLETALKSQIRINNQNIINQKTNLDKGFSRFILAQNNLIKSHQKHFDNISRLLNSLDYKQTLARGFAIIKDDNDILINSKNDAEKRRNLRIIFNDGELNVAPLKIKPVQGDLF